MTVISQISNQLKKNEKNLIQHKHELEHLKQMKKNMHQNELKKPIQELIKKVQGQILNDKTEIRICQARLRALTKK